MNINTRETLIDRVKQGDDQGAWEEFADVYGRYFYLIVRGLGIDRADADDLVQECLLAVWKAMPAFEYGKNGARFRTWAAVIARRIVIDFRRRGNRRLQTHSLEQIDLCDENLGDTDPKFLEFVDREWRTYVVNLALERIRTHFSGKAIQVFEAAIAGNSSAQIAVSLNLKPDSVRKLRSRVAIRLEKEVLQLRRALD